ncbi:uncharacterized protein IL334_000030 [Kwoniella shivajii]|uniref:Zn(2)-C6 fungal-type domain-containing protein n=1 Tax=Kwoniella shivajii TaxID=564305 RepID=A0ABZ1CN09_9TREE|nr:hypothetical protein IL334_000030 [Kwoniella shivajii]
MSREPKSPQPAVRGSADSFKLGQTQERSACEACRKRKIKCTGERPVCSRCQRLGKECVYESVVNTWTYIAALEKRLQAVESIVGSPYTPKRHQKGTRSRSPTDRRQRPYPVLGAGSNAAPHHTLAASHTPASSSTVNWRYETMTAQQKHHLQQPGIQDQGVVDVGWSQISVPGDAQVVTGLPLDNDLIGELSRQSGSIAPTSMAMVDQSLIPPAHVVNALVDHFRTCTGASYPIFHIPTLLRQIEAVSSTDGLLLPRADICVVILVLAVASTSLPLKSPLYGDYKARASVLWKYGQSILPNPDSVSGLTRLQITLIKLQYVLYNPIAGNVWDLSGAAIRLAVDLGLHLDSVLTVSPLEEDLRRRLFWISYNLERNVCTVLSRPPSIPDDWINASFPSLIDDTLISEDTIRTGNPSPLKVVAVHRFRLRILQSEILGRLYRPASATSPPPQEWYDSIVERLEIWRRTLPNSADSWSLEWSHTKYHLTLILLFRPTPACPLPVRECLAKTLVSAGRVMRAYKELYRSGSITFNWFTTYQLFLAAAAYLNALGQAARNGWDIVSSVIESLLDVQSCTSIMEAISTIAPGTSGIRDATNAVSEKIVRYLTRGGQDDTNVSMLSNFPNLVVPPQKYGLEPSADSHPSSSSMTAAHLDAIPVVGGDGGAGSDGWLLPPMHGQDGDSLMRLLGEIQPEDWEKCFGDGSAVQQPFQLGFPI